MIVETQQKGVTRRDFIKGAAAGAVGGLVAGAAGTALAAESITKMQPLVPAGRGFYRAMSAEVVQMHGHQGDRIEAYLARPTGAGRYPGVMVIHHMPGWDEATMEITRKFAHHGYVAICPDLHYREGKGTPEANSASVAATGGMPDNRTMSDIEGGIRYLRTLPYLNGKVGIIGYCSGGRQAYLAACTLKGIDAAVNLLWRWRGGGSSGAYAAPTCGSTGLYKGPELSLVGALWPGGQTSFARACLQDRSRTQEMGEDLCIPHV